jgi:hypothetical protein
MLSQQVRFSDAALQIIVIIALNVTILLSVYSTCIYIYIYIYIYTCTYAQPPEDAYQFAYLYNACKIMQTFVWYIRFSGIA